MSSSWLQTYTGKRFDFLEPDPDSICIEDIAHALSHIARFAGHTKDFYSVADHCVRASEIICEITKVERTERKLMQMYMLLHDASEAYLLDVPAPLKPHLTNYKTLEHNLMRVIAKRFGLDIEMFSDPRIRFVDMTMLATEKRDLLGPEPAPWIEMPEPYRGTVIPMSSKAAKESFLMRWEELGGVR